MRTLNRNKRNLYYANQTELFLIYELNSDGSIKTIIVDGEEVLVPTGDYETGYTKPQKFDGNIALSGGEIQNVEFGIDASSYDAVLVMNKGEINISETSLIWFKKEPVYKDSAKTIVDPNSADFRVTKVSPSINQDRFLLTKVVRNE